MLTNSTVKAFQCPHVTLALSTRANAMDRQIVCFAIPSLDIALTRLTTECDLSPSPRSTFPGRSSVKCPTKRNEKASHVGMSVDRARRLCPSLQVYPPNPQATAVADQSILTIIQRFEPAWEPSVPGSLMMDVTGTSRLFGAACDVAAKVQAEVFAQVHLEGVAGLGSNKLVAQTASTLVGPSELYDVPHGSKGRRDTNRR